MYIPKAFRETRPEVLQALIRQYSFGILVSQQTGEPFASHLPLLLDTGRGPQGTLLGHMARANPQWRDLQDGAEVLAIFPGPHAYISPSWYQTRLSVPTWNYVAIHAYGISRVVEDPTALRAIIETMVRTYESGLDPPWDMPLPDDFVTQMMKGIIGFEIEITRLEGKLKLGQNRSLADQQGAAAALERQDDAQGVEIARLMKQQLTPLAQTPTDD